MKISELIDGLVAIKKAQGDLDVVHNDQNQFSDVTGVEAITRKNCPEHFLWCFGGPVALLGLSKE